MKAILIKVLAPTNTRGKRFKLSAYGWPSKTYAASDFYARAQMKDVVQYYLNDLQTLHGLSLANHTRLAIGGIDNDTSAAVLFWPDEAFEIKASK